MMGRYHLYICPSSGNIRRKSYCIKNNLQHISHPQYNINWENVLLVIENKPLSEYDKVLMGWCKLSLEVVC